MTRFIFAEKFFLEDTVEGPGFLEIKEGRFGIFSEQEPGGSAEVIDYRDLWIAPGLVDTHIHGYKSHDVMEARHRRIVFKWMTNVEKLPRVMRLTLLCCLLNWN